jgi:hypothetical protein
MPTPLFDLPIVEVCWYGLASLASLLCFASLTYEVRAALEAAHAADNETALDVIKATYNVNFVVMIITNVILIASCLGIATSQGPDWHSWFALSILAAGAHWFYTRACEQKLLEYLRTAEVEGHALPNAGQGIEQPS